MPYGLSGKIMSMHRCRTMQELGLYMLGEFDFAEKVLYSPSHLTLLKDQQADAGGPAHYVRWVLCVAGEGAVVAEIQVLDQDGAITAAGVPHKLHTVPEWSLVVDVGGTTSVVEDLCKQQTNKKNSQMLRFALESLW